MADSVGDNGAWRCLVSFAERWEQCNNVMVCLGSCYVMVQSQILFAKALAFEGREFHNANNKAEYLNAIATTIANLRSQANARQQTVMVENFQTWSNPGGPLSLGNSAANSAGQGPGVDQPARMITGQHPGAASAGAGQAAGMVPVAGNRGAAGTTQPAFTSGQQHAANVSRGQPAVANRAVQQSAQEDNANTGQNSGQGQAKPQAVSENEFWEQLDVMKKKYPLPNIEPMVRTIINRLPTAEKPGYENSMKSCFALLRVDRSVQLQPNFTLSLLEALDVFLHGVISSYKKLEKQKMLNGTSKAGPVATPQQSPRDQGQARGQPGSSAAHAAAKGGERKEVFYVPVSRNRSQLSAAKASGGGEAARQVTSKSTPQQRPENKELRQVRGPPESSAAHAAGEGREMTAMAENQKASAPEVSRAIHLKEKEVLHAPVSRGAAQQSEAEASRNRKEALEVGAPKPEVSNHVKTVAIAQQVHGRTTPVQDGNPKGNSTGGPIKSSTTKQSKQLPNGANQNESMEKAGIAREQAATLSVEKLKAVGGDFSGAELSCAAEQGHGMEATESFVTLNTAERPREEAWSQAATREVGGLAEQDENRNQLSAQASPPPMAGQEEVALVGTAEISAESGFASGSFVAEHSEDIPGGSPSQKRPREQDALGTQDERVLKSARMAEEIAGILERHQNARVQDAVDAVQDASPLPDFEPLKDGGIFSLSGMQVDDDGGAMMLDDGPNNEPRLGSSALDMFEEEFGGKLTEVMEQTAEVNDGNKEVNLPSA